MSNYSTKFYGNIEGSNENLSYISNITYPIFTSMLEVTNYLNRDGLSCLYSGSLYYKKSGISSPVRVLESHLDGTVINNSVKNVDNLRIDNNKLKFDIIFNSGSNATLETDISVFLADVQVVSATVNPTTFIFTLTESNGDINEVSLGTLILNYVTSNMISSNADFNQDGSKLATRTAIKNFISGYIGGQSLTVGRGLSTRISGSTMFVDFGEVNPTKPNISNNTKLITSSSLGQGIGTVTTFDTIGSFRIESYPSTDYLHLLTSGDVTGADTWDYNNASLSVSAFGTAEIKSIYAKNSLGYYNTGNISTSQGNNSLVASYTNGSTYINNSITQQYDVTQFNKPFQYIGLNSEMISSPSNLVTKGYVDSFFNISGSNSTGFAPIFNPIFSGSVTNNGISNLNGTVNIDNNVILTTDKYFYWKDNNGISQKMIGFDFGGFFDIGNSTGFLGYGHNRYFTIGNHSFITKGAERFRINHLGVSILGVSGSGSIGFPTQTIDPIAPTNGFKLYANSTNALTWVGSNGFTKAFAGSQTASRTYTLQDSSGTLAMVSDFIPYAPLLSPNFSGSVLISGTLLVTGSSNINGLTVGRGNGNIDTNTAFGINALFANSGGENTAIGNGALKANTSGYWNTAVGSNALSSEINAIHNVAVGTNAQLSNLSGYDNTSVGYNSLLANLSGSNNVAIGKTSLSVSTGQYNTAIGSQSGTNNNQGNKNTYIGYNTGGGITTGNSNTIIGANVSGLLTSLSNNIIIADGDGNRRLNINENGNVGIGTSTPQSCAIVDITSLTQGLLLPRLTTTQINDITSPINGLCVFNVTLTCLCFYDGTGWRKVTHTAM